jgi:hypothetical protein
MFKQFLKTSPVVCFNFLLILVFSLPAAAQVEKGTKEISVFSGGFSADLNGSRFSTTTIDSNGVELLETTIKSQGFNLGGRFGYFLTRRNEVGGGTNLSFARTNLCRRLTENGTVILDTCNSTRDFRLGFDGFYRYNFAGANDKGFPFVGASIGVQDVTTNFTGNFVTRPEVGYKYFFKKNIALDVSAGVTFELNKKLSRLNIGTSSGGIIGGDDEEFFFDQNKRVRLNGQVGLSFIF